MTSTARHRTARQRTARQRGVALITVLLVFAVVAVIAAEMLRRSQLGLRSVSNLIDARQAWYYALGGEALARQVLAQDARDKTTKDSLDEPWAKLGEQPPFEIDQGAIKVEIYDLQGRFNLNSVVDEQGQATQGAALPRLRQLLTVLGVDAGYADTWLDWVDSNQAVSGNGAEDASYPDYQTAGAPEVDVSALRLLRGMTPEDYAKIAPHVTTLPATAGININTADETVLKALGPPISQQVSAIRVRQRQGGYADLQQLLGESGGAGDSEGGEASGDIGVRSQYFEVITSVKYLDQTLRLRSVLKREQNSGAITVRSRARIPIFDNTNSESSPP